MPMKRSGEGRSEDQQQQQDEPFGNTSLDEEDSGIKKGEDINMKSYLLRSA